MYHLPQLPSVKNQENISLDVEPLQPRTRRFMKYIDKPCQTNNMLENPRVEVKSEKQERNTSLNNQPIVKIVDTDQLINHKKTEKFKPPKNKTMLNRMPLYEVDEDRKKHCFVCEKLWTPNDITDEDKQMAQFAASLRKRVLTWFMNFTEYHIKSKDKIKTSFFTLFKVRDVKHVAAQKLKEIK